MIHGIHPGDGEDIMEGIILTTEAPTGVVTTGDITMDTGIAITMVPDITTTMAGLITGITTDTPGHPMLLTENQKALPTWIPGTGVAPDRPEIPV